MSLPVNPVAFIETVMIDPESQELFRLTPAEKTFLEFAFELTSDGRLRFPELVFAGPKKSGKTCFGAMLAIYVVRAIGGRFAEGFILANSLDQASLRVFTAAKRIVEASPLLREDARVTSSTITFLSTGAVLSAIPSDYATAAGANPAISVFDELWGFTSERDQRLFDEMVPSPARQISVRLTVTYAGFEGESKLLEGLYKRGIVGQEIAPDLYAAGGLLMYWSHSFSAPWQTEAWREQMREQLRPNAYLRLIENRWVSTESNFIDLEWWDECTDPEASPEIADASLPVYVGIDASTKRDSTAIVATAYDHDLRKVRLVFHRVFQPSPDDVLDFEQTIESTVLYLDRAFRLRECLFDPYQMASTSARLEKARIPMREFPQTSGNLTLASSNLYELVKGRNLVLYPDADMRLAVSRSVAIESSRGWRITKEKASHKIDVVVALAQAALGAVESVTKPGLIEITPEMMRLARLPPGPGRFAEFGRDRHADICGPAGWYSGERRL